LKILFSHYGIRDADGFGRSFMLARELAQLGHSVTFLTSQRGYGRFPYEKEMRDNVCILSFAEILPVSFRKGGLGILATLLKCIYIIGKDYDIVHSDSGHRPASGLPCRLHKFLYRSLYVSEWWDYFGKGGMYDEMPFWYRITLGSYDTRAEISNKKKADGVIALSEFTKQRALAIGIKESNILVLHGGADVRSIQFIPNTDYKKKYGLEKADLTFGFVGMNEGEVIDLEPFFQAIAKLPSSVKINIFTTGRKLSQSTKNKYFLGDNFIEFGWVDYIDYSEILSCADVFLLLQQDITTNIARWPNKAGDYLAAGRPVLTNNIGDIGLIASQNPGVFYMADWNEASVSACISEIYQHKPDEPVFLRIRELANMHSWHNKATELVNFYKSISTVYG
jgi:glycosyltransferase involved in cell wall biosynthesis